MIIPPAIARKKSAWRFDCYVCNVARTETPWGNFVETLRRIYASGDYVPHFHTYEQLSEFVRCRLDDVNDDVLHEARIVWDLFIRWQKMRETRSSRGHRCKSDLGRDGAKAG